MKSNKWEVNLRGKVKENLRVKFRFVVVEMGHLDRNNYIIWKLIVPKEESNDYDHSYIKYRNSLIEKTNEFLQIESDFFLDPDAERKFIELVNQERDIAEICYILRIRERIFYDWIKIDEMRSKRLCEPLRKAEIKAQQIER